MYWRRKTADGKDPLARPKSGDAAPPPGVAPDARMLALIAHELTAPLEALVAQQAAILAGEPGDRVEAHARRALLIGEHMRAFLRNLAEFVRLERGATALAAEPFDLRELVVGAAAIFRVLAEHKGLGLDVAVEPAVEGVYVGDALRLRQVLINLVKNAVTYSNTGTVRLAARRVAGGVEFSVSDEGGGMNEDTARAILEGEPLPARGDFSGGLGLGLALSRRLVLLMRGTFAIESVEGRGARVSVTIDLPPSGAAAPRRRPAIPV